MMDLSKWLGSISGAKCSEAGAKDAFLILVTSSKGMTCMVHDAWIPTEAVRRRNCHARHSCTQSWLEPWNGTGLLNNETKRIEQPNEAKIGVQNSDMSA